jgi:hypothetical protein
VLTTTTDYAALSATRIGAVQAGELSAREVVDTTLACITDRDQVCRISAEAAGPMPMACAPSRPLSPASTRYPDDPSALPRTAYRGLHLPLEQRPARLYAWLVVLLTAAGGDIALYWPW